MKLELKRARTQVHPSCLSDSLLPPSPHLPHSHPSPPVPNRENGEGWGSVEGIRGRQRRRMLEGKLCFGTGDWQDKLTLAG